MKSEADELAAHIITQMQTHDQLSALDHPFPYHCSRCGATWMWNFHDIMELTSADKMPCGCAWQHLDFSPFRSPRS